MPHFPKPFWRARTSSYYVDLGGTFHRLGPDWPRALRKYASLLAGELSQETPGEEEEKKAEPEPVTLEDAVAQFLTSCRARLKARTVQWYAERLGWMRLALLPGATLLSQLTASRVEGWALDDKKDWSPSYRRGLLTAAARLAAWAARRGLLESDPLVGRLDKPASGPRDRVLSRADFDRLAGCYPPASPFRRLLVFCWETGCRPQEATGAEVGHYQPAARRLSLPASKAKGGEAARHVYLTPAAEEAVAAAGAGRGAGRLFLNGRGAPWTRHAVACSLARAAGALGVKYRLYDLRHSFAHRMLVAGLSAATVAHLMGHSGTQMVLRVYGHLEAADGFLREELRRGNLAG